MMRGQRLASNLAFYGYRLVCLVAAFGLGVLAGTDLGAELGADRLHEGQSILWGWLVRTVILLVAAAALLDVLGAWRFRSGRDRRSAP